MSDQAAIHTAIEAAAGAFVTRWIVVAEVTDNDSGTQSLITMPSPGLAQWDATGFLRYAEYKASDS